MTNRDIILNELRDLKSSLGNYNPQNIYTVPNGYFEGLPTQILNRIKALESTNAKDELKYLSPLLNNLSKEMPYAVPAGFFQDLSEDVLKKIKAHDDHQTSEEEIETLSPLLSSLKTKNPYSLPAGYFERLETGIVPNDSPKESFVTLGEMKEAKVISITSRKWFRLAAAAIVIGIVAVSGLFLIKNRPTDGIAKTEKIIKEVVKKVDAEKIDEFVSLTNDDNEKTDMESDAAKKAEIKELMKDVPEKEIEAFLNDAIALESNTDTDGIMNE